MRSLLLLAAFVSWGCPGDRPCAYVDRGADAGALVTSACPPLACPDGATPASTGRCSCRAGLWPVLGACVDQDLGTRFCGKGARFREGVCVPISCAADEGIDFDHGLCLPVASVDEASGLRLEGEEHARCRDPRSALVIRLPSDSRVTHGSALCVPTEAMCARGTRGAKGCSAPRCAAGEVPDETLGRCVRVVRPEGSSHVVDVAQWAHAVLGTDGGSATQTLCHPLLTAGSEVLVGGRVDMRIDLVFPGNDVTSVSPTVTVLPGDNRGIQAPTVIAAIGDLIEPLRAMGGSSSAAVVSTHFVCDIPALQGAMATIVLPDAGPPK